jgi:hypothetical protein
MRKELEGRLTAIRARVSIDLVRHGDFVEYIEVNGGWHVGRVVRMQPRARRVVLGGPRRADLPRGAKDLAHNGHRNVLVHEAQLVGILVGPVGGRQVARPGTPAWDALVAERNGRPKG